MYIILFENLFQGFRYSSLIILCFVFLQQNISAGVGEGVSSVGRLSSIAIILNSPDAGQSWQAGSSHLLSWKYIGPSDKNTIIEYSTDNGTNWINVTTVPATSSPYNWSIPNTVTTQAKVRMRSNDYPTVGDTSENVLAIFSYPQTVNINSTVTFGEVTDITNYKIVGLPGNTNIPVSLAMTGDSPYDWNAYWDNGATTEYQVKYVEIMFQVHRKGFLVAE